MNEHQTIGVVTLAALVVGMVIYRVVWFLGREKRRQAGARGFQSKDSH
jgi:hypothetical protein